MIRIIKNILRLRRIIKDPSILNMDRFFEWFKGLTKLERKYALKAVLAYRKVCPYQVHDYSEARDLYEDYFKLTRSISSFTELKQKFKEQGELYITSSGKDYPVKGERWCEYFFRPSFDCEEKVYKVYNVTYDTVVVDFNIYVSKANLTAFKYSSEKEIKAFKRDEIRKASLQKKIREKEKEIKELRKLIND